jgi:myosin heavy subunit
LGKRNWEPVPQHEEMYNVELNDPNSTPTISSLTLEEEADGDIGCLRSIVIGVYYRFNIGGYRNRRDIHKSKKVCKSMLAKVDAKVSKTEDRTHVLENMLKKQVKNKNRRQAKKYLQQLKRARKNLNGFMSYKGELETMLISLDQTEDQTDFVMSFKAARKALSGHSKTLPIADFEDFVDDMEETKADLEDFHNTLSQRTDVQYTDIEAELDAMFSENTPSSGGGGPSDDQIGILMSQMPIVPLPSVRPAYTAGELTESAETQLKILEDAI